MASWLPDLRAQSCQVMSIQLPKWRSQPPQLEIIANPRAHPFEPETAILLREEF